MIKMMVEEANLGEFLKEKEKQNSTSQEDTPTQPKRKRGDDGYDDTFNRHSSGLAFRGTVKQNLGSAIENLQTKHETNLDLKHSTDPTSQGQQKTLVRAQRKGVLKVSSLLLIVKNWLSLSKRQGR